MWHNQSTIPRTATGDSAKPHGGVVVQLPPGTAPWNSGNVYSRQSRSYTLDTPGEYLYLCDFHIAQNMLGTITVTP